jgi:hypothetical protein
VTGSGDMWCWTCCAEILCPSRRISKLSQQALCHRCLNSAAGVCLKARTRPGRIVPAQRQTSQSKARRGGSNLWHVCCQILYITRRVGARAQQKRKRRFSTIRFRAGCSPCERTVPRENRSMLRKEK